MGDQPFADSAHCCGDAAAAPPTGWRIFSFSKFWSEMADRLTDSADGAWTFSAVCEND